MQERRSTIRIAQNCRVQYCAAEDLLPRDGHVANISERGVGLLVREQHKVGDHVTVSFNLPGLEEALTATGAVRWSSSLRQGRWYRLGMEWLPLEESTRNRLHAFLNTQAKPEAAEPQPKASGQRFSFNWLVWLAWVVALLTLAALWYSWIAPLKRQAQALNTEVEQREAIITTLQQRERELAQRQLQLKGELQTAQSHLATASEEIAQLDVQSRQAAGDAQRLSQEVQLFQQSYARVQSEREQLIQQVLQLEQERLQLKRKLSSVPELQLAIREAIDARKQAQREARRIQRSQWLQAFGQTGRLTDTEIREQDNRGYIIKDGKPTVTRSTVWIRVRDPEAK